MFYLSFCKRNVLRAGSRDVNHPPSMILPEKAHRKQGSEGGGERYMKAHACQPILSF